MATKAERSQNANLPAQYILNRCFNAGSNGIRTGTATTTRAADTEYTVQTIFNRIFSEATDRIALNG